MGSASRQRRPRAEGEGTRPGATRTGLARFTSVDALFDQLEWRQGERRARADRRDGAGPAAPGGGAQGLEAVRELCHDMRQPLAVIAALTAELLAEPRMHAEDQRRLAQMVEETSHLSWFVSAFLSGPEAEPVDLSGLVREAASSAGVTFAGDLELDVEDAVLTHGDPVVLYRAILNLLDNACRVVGPAGRVRVALRRDADGVRVDVSDDGPGLGAPPAGGPGLGLSIVRGAVERHGGQLQFGASDLGGTRVRLLLPDGPS